jgi:hypothetical protein
MNGLLISPPTPKIGGGTGCDTDERILFCTLGLELLFVAIAVAVSIVLKATTNKIANTTAANLRLPNHNYIISNSNDISK